MLGRTTFGGRHHKDSRLPMLLQDIHHEQNVAGEKRGLQAYAAARQADAEFAKFVDKVAPLRAHETAEGLVGVGGGRARWVDASPGAPFSPISTGRFSESTAPSTFRTSARSILSTSRAHEEVARLHRVYLEESRRRAAAEARLARLASEFEALQTEGGRAF